MGRKGASGRKKLTTEEKEILLRRSNGKCAHCGKHLDVDSMTIEHLYPVSKGGSNHTFNVVAFCEDCNENKSNFTIGSIIDYCPFIDEQYVENYQNRYNEETVVNDDANRFISHDEQQFYYMHDAGYDMLCKMIYEGRKRKDIVKIANAFLKPLVLEKAYYSDLEKIYERCRFDDERVELRCEEISNMSEIYYRSLDGEVESYVIKLGSNEPVGFLVMDKVTYGKDIDYNEEIDNILKKTNLQVKYVTRHTSIASGHPEARDKVSSWLFLQFISKGYVPIFMTKSLGQNKERFEQFDTNLGYRCATYKLDTLVEVFSNAIKDLCAMHELNSNEAAEYILGIINNMSDQDKKKCDKFIHKKNLYQQLNPKKINNVIYSRTKDPGEDGFSVRIYNFV